MTCAAKVATDNGLDEEDYRAEYGAVAPEDDHADTCAGTSGSGGYKFDTAADREDIKAQRQAVWVLLKGVGSTLLRDGVNLTKISLPVRVFEPRSFLQRITDNWAYLDLLEIAAATADPADRMKYLVAFVIGGLRRATSTLKPFNPILGETHQSEYSSGVTVAAEQISHHPPISSWDVRDKHNTFRFYGNGNWVAAARGNSIKGQQSGKQACWFASDGATVTWELPPLHLRGIMWGERVLKYSGEIHFQDDLNNLSCVVQVDPQPAASFISALWRSKKSQRAQQDAVRGSLVQRGQVLDSVSGSWLTHVEWERGVRGGKVRRLWDVHTSPVRSPAPITAPLESDSRFRQDLQCLQRGDQDASQEWKSKLEEVQRQDRRLRKEGLKQPH